MKFKKKVIEMIIFIRFKKIETKFESFLKKKIYKIICLIFFNKICILSTMNFFFVYGNKVFR